MLLGMRSSLLSGVAFTPAALFASGEQGVWYDPSDFSTLFQDSAGTTPVTAVEQPVGLMLDLSGRGNHATQATPGARPTLSARVNLLTKTEEFNDAAWVKSGASPSTVTANTTLAPDGTTTADTITTSATPAGELVYQDATISSGASARFSQCFKRGNHDWVRIAILDGVGVTNGAGAWFNIATGAVGADNITGTGVLTSKTITSLGDGWYRCTVVGSAPGTTTYRCLNASADADASFTRVSNGTRIVWGADIRVANDTALPVYQRVNTATDYDATGFPYYLQFDGSNDSMATASINFTATAQMTSFSGVRNFVAPAVFGVITEFSANQDANNGTFSLGQAAAGPTSASRGTISRAAIATIASPSTYVLTGIGSIPDDICSTRVNGVQAASNSLDQGTGNYGNYPLYIGARGGTSFFFNGRLYSLIVRGAATSETQIGQTEQWISNEMGGGYYPTGFDFLVTANGDQLTDASGNPLYTQPLYL